MKYVIKEDVLVHHGVKGQQWGVRRGPPYPIQDTVIKKGTRVSSVSATYLKPKQYRKNGRWLYTYNPQDPHDRSFYTGPFLQQTNALKDGRKFVAEHSFYTVRDLKMPTSKERIGVLLDIYNDPNAGPELKKDLVAFKKFLIDNHPKDSKYRIAAEKLPDDMNLMAPGGVNLSNAYKIFGEMMRASHVWTSTREYSRRMEEKWDAMVDDHDAISGVHDPIIFFKADKVLSDAKRTPVNKLFSSDIRQNTNLAAQLWSGK